MAITKYLLLSMALMALPSVHPAPVADGPQVTWAAVGRAPLSDAQAAALVTHEREVRPSNVWANRYIPSDAQLRAFYRTRDNRGRLITKYNRWYAYVTGRPGLVRPSTGDLIQWAAFKWGVPVDVLRAILVDESWWYADGLPALGDRTHVSRAWYYKYPPEARISYRWVWESEGIAQEKWRPDQSVNAGTNPLRYLSTAFSIDYLGATLRYYYDGKCGWCGKGYRAGNAWGSVGAWNQPRPWGNAKSVAYYKRVQQQLAVHRWTYPDWIATHSTLQPNRRELCSGITNPQYCGH